MPFDQISSAGMVARDLAAVWEWFDYRLGVLRQVRPNPAHMTIASWQDRFASFTLVTQNVDGLHSVAGSRDVLELHGNIRRARCVSCDERVAVEDLDPAVRPPVCTSCGDPMRPDVVLFGEMLPVDVFHMAAERAAECELCVVVGTSAIVYPASELPMIARASGAYLVEVNPERTPLSHICDEVIKGKAGEVMPLLNR
jgi:NAD-dependent deacetylase